MESIRVKFMLIEDKPSPAFIHISHPGFINSNADRLKTAFDKFDKAVHEETVVLFSAHSIPNSMAENCSYEKQFQEAGKLIAQELAHKNYKFVYQSRSGPPTQPWLEPDVLDALEQLKNDGVETVIVHPIGFISDHMEVIYDLDTEAKELASKLGINYVRAETVGVHNRFVEMIHELITEHTDGNSAKCLGEMGLVPDQCSTSCCTYSPMGSTRR